MPYNGHKKSLLKPNEPFKNKLKTRYGKNNPTVYYSFLKDPDRNRYYLNYHMFYSFDPKGGFWSPSGQFASHAFDRESMTLVFDGPIDINTSTPTKVVFGAHLETQTMELLDTGDKSVQSFSHGRVKVLWDTAQKYPDNSMGNPIVAVAEGSHALYPICGYYKVHPVTNGDWHLKENACGGEKDDDTANWNHVLTPRRGDYTLKPLGLEHITSAGPNGYLAFSGYWVDVGDLLAMLGYSNAKFPPFTGREGDPQDWVENADTWDMQNIPQYSEKLMDELISKLGKNNLSPTASITSPADPSSYYIGDTISFNGTGTDADGYISSYLWDFGDSSTSTMQLPTHSYSSAGTYTVSLTVTDDVGATGTDSTTITINNPLNNSPTASITSPQSGSPYSVGDFITFNGTGFDTEDGALSGASLVWTSSIDGQIGIDTTFTSSTLSAGTHTITLTATDSYSAAGNASISITVNATSTPQTWAKTYGGGSEDRAQSVQQTSDGGYIMAGHTWSFGTGSYDALVVKLNSDGTIAWQKTYDGLTSSFDSASSIQQTSDGGYIMVGGIFFGAGGGGVWVVKLNSDGTIAWQKTYGGSSIDYASSIQQTSDGGYIVAGHTWSSGARGGPWIVKLNSDGTIAWQKTYGGSKNAYFQSIQQTSDGGYIMAGYDDDGQSDAWIVKLNSDGTIAWQKTYGSSSIDGASSIQQTSDGGYIVAGMTWSFGTGSYDVWVVKLNSDGTIAWQKTYGGSLIDRPSSIQQTSDGGYIVAGNTWSSGVKRGAWVVKLNSDGAVAWQKAYSGPGYDYASSITQTSDGGFVVAGYTDSFGAGDDDAWVMKLDSNGDIGGVCGLVSTTSITPVNTSVTGVDTSVTPADTAVSAVTSYLTESNSSLTEATQCAGP